LAIGTIGGWQSKASLLAVVAILGAAQAFENPAMTALVPGVVTRPLIAPAMAWVISAGQTAQIAGPALGGFLYALGPGAAYFTSAALFVLSGALATVIRSERTARHARADHRRHRVLGGRLHPEPARAARHDVARSVRGAARRRHRAPARLARDILHTGPGGLGLLRSAPAVGALATSVFLARHPLERRIGSTLFRSVIVFGAATAVFGLSTSFALSLVALSVLGAADVVSMVIRSSLAQIRTPDAMRGRVSAVSSLFTGTSNQLGAFESGWRRRCSAPSRRAAGRARDDRGGRPLDGALPGAAPPAHPRGVVRGACRRNPARATEKGPAASAASRWQATRGVVA
jgi:hypothetical protein